VGRIFGRGDRAVGGDGEVQSIGADGGNPLEAAVDQRPVVGRASDCSDMRPTSVHWPTPAPACTVNAAPSIAAAITGGLRHAAQSSDGLTSPKLDNHRPPLLCRGAAPAPESRRARRCTAWSRRAGRGPCSPRPMRRLCSTGRPPSWCSRIRWTCDDSTRRCRPNSLHPRSTSPRPRRRPSHRRNRPIHERLRSSRPLARAAKAPEDRRCCSERTSSSEGITSTAVAQPASSGGVMSCSPEPHVPAERDVELGGADTAPGSNRPIVLLA